MARLRHIVKLQIKSANCGMRFSSTRTRAHQTSISPSKRKVSETLFDAAVALTSWSKACGSAIAMRASTYMNSVAWMTGVYASLVSRVLYRMRKIHLLIEDCFHQVHEKTRSMHWFAPLYRHRYLHEEIEGNDHILDIYGYCLALEGGQDSVE